MEELYTLFESYQDGSMPPQEREAFSRRLQLEPELKQAFEAYQAIRSSYQQSWEHVGEQEALKKSLQKVETDFFPSEKKGGRKVWIWVAAAAAIALLLFLFLPTADLFQQYYETPVAALTVKSGDRQQLVQEAETAFNAGNFQTALSLFDRILTPQNDELQIRFYRGICLLELENGSAARAALQPIADGPSALAADARWYLAMSYLKEEDYANCRQVLKKMPTDSPRSPEVSRLLNKLAGR